ncbi:MAG: VWA domain-containing protein [Candidatus Heimdallarchaeum endolithica]|uniref:VWA domain-containing protein n=1 Tax=Candidatus Heimdallarchaeum endolithica TaxID=2876572 RepID=A0A9Y1BSF6_9ARCH|nr:MAG: VWA domain-containing protein [Candidatus Heimdallarchaeum endolithica]
MSLKSHNIKAATYWNTLLSSINSKNKLENIIPKLCKENGLPQNFLEQNFDFKDLTLPEEKQSEEIQQFQKLLEEKRIDFKNSSLNQIIKQIMTMREEQNPEDKKTSSSSSNFTNLQRLVFSKVFQEIFQPVQKSKVTANDFSEWKENKQLCQEAFEEITQIEVELEKQKHSKKDLETTIDDISLSEKEKEKLTDESPIPLIEGEKAKVSSKKGKGKQKSLEKSPIGGTEKGQGFFVDRRELEEVFDLIENEMISKMKIIELLQDDELAKKVSPSIGIVEQLLHLKKSLPASAMTNAKMIIKKYVREVSDLFKTRFDKSIKKVPNPDIVPKKVFRNLDLQRTIWKNLPNYDIQERKLYVDRLYYHRAGKKELPSKVVIVVDQSGSMVEAMVQTVILASIFAQLPKVNVDLLAFDTKVIDLTKYVNDPLEALLKTNLGGGTSITYALKEAQKKIQNPSKTALVLITDYYEGGNAYEKLFNTIKDIKDNGTKFISIASMTRKGYVDVNSNFVHALKKEGIETIMGNFDRLIELLRKYLL